MSGSMDYRHPERTFVAYLLVLLCGYYKLLANADANNVSGNASEYCEGTSFTARCPNSDEVIVVGSALFGRMRIGARCIKTSPGVGPTCQFNIRDQFDLWCSGRRSCEVRVSSIVDILPQNKLCLQDHRGYLEASYSCVKTVTRRKEDCDRPHTAADLPVSGFGYLASISTEETGCGSTEFPWVLRASPGQQIRLKMYDFAVANRDTDPSVDQYPRVCQVYAVIKETPVRTSETICGGEEREQTVYTSVTNQLELRLVAASVGPKKNQTRKVFYLLRYEVTGCPDLVPGPGQWVARQEHVSTLVCNSTGERWQLNCENGDWIGQRRNCTSSEHSGSDPNKSHLVWAIFTGSQWAAIAIILGIAVTIGLIIFLVGLFYLKRRRPAAFRGGPSGCATPHCIPSYHLAHCTDPILPIPGSKSLQSTRSGDANYSSAENDYFRTWQLQRQVSPHCSASGQSSGPRFTVLRACPAGGQFQGTGPAVSVEPGVPCGGRRAVIEHIYESPKFERRDLSTPEGSETPGQRPGTPLQYHELDPHIARA